MSKIDELLVALAPGGVEFRTLEDLVKYEQPGKYLVESTDYNDLHATPVLTAGQTFILGYTAETTGIYPASGGSPVIIFDDFTTAFKWVDFPFKAKSSAMKMLTLKTPDISSLRYIYYAMQSIRYDPQDHARQWIGIYSQFRIPVPPLEVQREIVTILDQFTQLEAELEAELEARRTQYEHYRHALLAFGSVKDWVKLSDIADYVNGKAHEKLADPAGDVAMVTARFVSRNGEANRYVQLDDVLTPAVIGDIALVLSDLPNGRALARTFYVDKDDTYAINQRVARLRVIDSTRNNSRFLYHYLNRNSGLLRHDNGVDQTHLSKGQVTGLRIPVVARAEQDRIVEVLDKFEALVSDLSVGLPAELTARRKQYEYYRDKLTSFGEVAS